MPKCKKIEITCESHDQGWSPYPQDQGTYNNSWTWGEISIIPKQNNDLQGHLIENESKTRYKVYTNKHAVEDWQTHKFVFLSEHPLVQSLQPGDIVGFYIRSLHPADKVTEHKGLKTNCRLSHILAENNQENMDILYVVNKFSN
ncbi:31490_t:CDS:2 [Gigaspora margarita]|uniref:31490_t:CDS:1 n=1 Tax=Gigaspora margarita TaxID=4874 RepID=A0ABN7UJY3_GIGMA|nr:31490_t:CDS:2 [Gigaspora margarita]